MKVLSQSKIPEQFRGRPLPEKARACIATVDSKHNLSAGEIEWLLESLEDDYSMIRQADSANWDRTAVQLGKIFDFVRKNSKSVLRTTLSNLTSESQNYFANEGFKQTFENCPQGMRYLWNSTAAVKDGFIHLNSMIDGGLNDKELMWIGKKGANGSQMTSESFRNNLARIVKWSRATDTDLNTMNDYGTANTLAEEWADYQRKTDLSKRLSKRGLKAVGLSGGWKAVWIDPNAQAKPGIAAGGGRRDNYEYEVEQEITGYSSSNSDKLISIRDKNGVPQASIEIADESAEKIDVGGFDGTVEGKNKIKEFVKKMAQSGVRLWWNGDSEEMSNIKEFAENAYDPYGFVPALSISGIGGIGHDVDSYKEAMQLAYDAGWGGSSLYTSTAKKLFDALAHYAEERVELHILEKARQQFAEWANEQWWEAESQLQTDNVIPDRPDEDDEKYNSSGVFNAQLYSADDAAYQSAVEPYEKDFEPNAFDQYAYEQVQTRYNKPDHRAEYDAIAERERIQEAERHKKWELEQETARKQREEAEEAERKIEEERFVARALNNPDAPAQGIPAFEPTEDFTIGTTKKEIKVGSNFQINVIRLS